MSERESVVSCSSARRGRPADGYLALLGRVVFQTGPSRLVFTLGALSLVIGVLAREPGFESPDPCPVALVGVACLLERLAASPPGVVWPGRPCLRELPFANIGDPRALVSGVISLIRDCIALVGHALSFLGAARAHFEKALQPVDDGGIRRDRFGLTRLVSHCQRA